MEGLGVCERNIVERLLFNEPFGSATQRHAWRARGSQRIKGPAQFFKFGDCYSEGL